MRLRSIIANAVGIGLVFLPDSARSQDFGYYLSGNDLYKMCQANVASAEAYVMGFADGMTYRDEMLNARGDVSFCAPMEVKSTQMRDVACQYLQAHPESRHRRAIYLLQDALANAWPCS